MEKASNADGVHVPNKVHLTFIPSKGTSDSLCGHFVFLRTGPLAVATINLLLVA